MSRHLQVALLVSVCVLLFACEREKRDFRTPTSAVSPGTTPAPQSPLEPGNPDPNRVTAMQQPAMQMSESGSKPYESNAYSVSEGKRLYEAYNCVGCHAHGGGGMGPPLMDANWIYGGTPQNIHDTIVEGRPNGMPSFRGKIPDFQVWEITAYVRSMSGQLPKDIAPGRDDHMSVKKPEQVTPGAAQHQR